MKNKTKKFAVKLSSFTRILILSILLLMFINANAQPPFDRKYGSVLNADDGAGNDFVTCASVHQDYTYVAVQSIFIPSPGPGQNATYGIRGARIKNDGTMLVSNFDYIQENSLNYNIFPLKIIPINNNSEYLITGYVTPVSGIYAAPIRPRPFVIKADANLDATLFKIFDHEGFFTDVDEIPNSGGDLLFVGSLSYLTTIASYYRSGWMMRTDATTFTASWMRFVHTTSSASSHNYNIVHDAIIYDDDHAIVCGTTNEGIRCGGNPNVDSFQARGFLAKLNLSDGSFGWQRSVFSGELGIKLAINDAESIIAFATQGETGGKLPSLSFFQIDGTFISRKCFEVDVNNLGPNIEHVYFNYNGTSYYDTKILVHYPQVINNIYFMDNDEDVFISGKFVKVQVNDLNNSSLIGEFDMPYSLIYDYNNSTFSDISLYKTSQKFQPPVLNFLTYNEWHAANCPGHVYAPFYTASNTLPCLSNCGTDEYVTVTCNAASYGGTVKQDKMWVFSNDVNVCKVHSDNTLTYEPEIDDDYEIDNDDILASPQTDDLGYYNTDLGRYTHDCIQSGPPPDE